MIKNTETQRKRNNNRTSSRTFFEKKKCKHWTSASEWIFYLSLLPRLISILIIYSLLIFWANLIKKKKSNFTQKRKMWQSSYCVCACKSIHCKESDSFADFLHLKTDCSPTTQLYRAALKECIIDWTNLLNKYACHCMRVWMSCWVRDERVWMTDDYAQLTWHQLWVACWKCSAFVHIEQNRLVIFPAVQVKPHN